MSDRAALEVTLGSGQRAPRRIDDGPLRILILGGFSAPVGNPGDSLKTQQVSIDNFEGVLERISPAVSLAGEALTISSLDQFHPDYLAGKLGLIQQLQGLNSRLGDPATEQEAMAELASLTGTTPTPVEDEDSPAASEAPAALESEDHLLDRLLGQQRPADESRSRAQQKVQALIQEAVGGAQVESASGLAKMAQDQVTELLNNNLRAALAAPEFRELERAWRSLHWLVTRVEDDQAEIHLLDLSEAALKEHLETYGERLDTSPLHRLLCEDEDGWDLILGDYSFELDADDVVLLATVGALAARAGAPFIAHGDLTLAGCASPEGVEAPWDWSVPDDGVGDLWQELRGHPAARWVGLAAPRFLLRYPYGKQSDPIEAFPFEELPARPEPECFLWGNPAFACALIMSQAHEAGAGDWPVTVANDVEDLPTPVYDDGGGEAMQPPVEFLLNERARATAEQSGLIVFASGRNTNRMSTSGLFPLAQ